MANIQGRASKVAFHVSNFGFPSRVAIPTSDLKNATGSPDGPKNGNFQTPRRGLFIFGMVSLEAEVKKRQTRAVSLKTTGLKTYKQQTQPQLGLE